MALPSLSRRRGTARSVRVNNRTLMLFLFGSLTVVMTLAVAMFMGLLVFGNTGGNANTTTAAASWGFNNNNNNVPPPRGLEQSPGGLLRGGSKLQESWNEKSDNFREYLHKKHDHGVAKAAAAEAAQQQQQQEWNTPNNSSSSTSSSSQQQQKSSYSLSEQSSSNFFQYPHMGSPPPVYYNIATSWSPPGGQRFVEYTDGSSPYSISVQQRQKSDDLARLRRVYVKKAMKFAWAGYEQYAWGMDEILPISRRGTNNWGGFAVTMIDSLDTLWLMDMKEEFYRARDYVHETLNHDKGARSVSFFETTIRSVGGLLSAYDWSGDKIFLESALDLARRLIKAFNDSPTGIPFGQVNLQTGKSSNIAWAGNNAILAEFGTVQLEYRWLDVYVGTPETAEMRRKVEHVFEILRDMAPENGLFPYYMKNENSGKPAFANDHITFGAMADSFYEYMLKIWIQGGKMEPLYRQMYDKSIQGMHDELLFKSEPSGLYYIADKMGGAVDHKMDHLVCFMGGQLALGAYTDPRGLDSQRARRDLKTGRALAYTCYQMYARMNTGISAEYVQFEKGADFGIGVGAPHYLLRPETVESFFILNQLTGDPIYREWGWEIFQSIEKFCKTGVGYGTLKDVTNTNQSPNDKTETFWLAETLKYLYLLFDPDTEVDILNKHVFNTEAHPIRTFAQIKESDTFLNLKDSAYKGMYTT